MSASPLLYTYRAVFAQRRVLLYDSIETPMDEREAYEILGLDPGATPLQVKHAYRRAALAWHPDRSPTQAGRLQYVKRFLSVRDAYEFLRANDFPDLPAKPQEDPEAMLPPLYQAPDWLVAHWEREARAGAWDWLGPDEQDFSVLWRLAIIMCLAFLLLLAAQFALRKGLPRHVKVRGVDIGIR